MQLLWVVEGGGVLDVGLWCDVVVVVKVMAWVGYDQREKKIEGVGVGEHRSRQGVGLLGRFFLFSLKALPLGQAKIRPVNLKNLCGQATLPS